MQGGIILFHLSTPNYVPGTALGQPEHPLHGVPQCGVDRVELAVRLRQDPVVLPDLAPDVDGQRLERPDLALELVFPERVVLLQLLVAAVGGLLTAVARGAAAAMHREQARPGVGGQEKIRIQRWASTMTT